MPSSAWNEWRSLISEHFLLSYKNGDERIAREVLNHGEEVLPSMTSHLGVDLTHTEKIRVFLTSTQEDFDRLTRNGVPDWGIGCALPEERLIVLKSPRQLGKNPNLRSLISHEISHILLGQRIKRIQQIQSDPYGEFTDETSGPYLPRWFDEGIAMFESKEWRMGESATLAIAVLTNSLLPLSTLETQFPVREREAHLAYIQSFSTIAYLLETYGEANLQNLLRHLSNTGNFEEAFKVGFGMTPEHFQEEWHSYLKSHYNILLLLSDSRILWGSISLLFLFTLIFKTVQNRKKGRELGDDHLPFNSN